MSTHPLFCRLLAIVLLGAGLAPTPAAAQRQALDRGIALDTAMRYAEAITEFTRAIEENPELAEAWRRRGWSRQKDRQYAPALEDVDRALQLDPADAEAHKNRAAALISLNRHQEALAAATRSLELRPGYSAGYYYRAFAHLRLGNYPSMEADATRALEGRADNASAYFLRGIARYELKQHPDGLADLDMAQQLGLEPNRSLTYYRGLHRRALGDLAGARPEFEETLRLDSADARAWAMMGECRLAAGDVERAIRDIRKALTLDPKLTFPRPTLDRALQQQASRSAPTTAPALLDVPTLRGLPSETSLLAAVRRSPTRDARAALARARFEHAVARAEVAATSLDEETHGEAVAYAESATQLDPDDAAYWLLLGRLYLAYDDNAWALALAEDALRRSTELDPSIARTWVALGEVHAKRESHHQALGAWEAALELDAALAEPALVSAMGWSYLADGQERRGAAFFRWMVRRPGSPPAARIGLAVLLRERGELDWAIRELQAVIEDRAAPEAVSGYARELLSNWRSGGVP